MSEFGADLLGTPAQAFRVGDDVIGYEKRDLQHYWREDSEFGSSVRWRLSEPLKEALETDRDVMILAHSLGSMVAYDVLWKFSHTGEYRHIREAEITHFVTIGSPLGDPIVMG